MGTEVEGCDGEMEKREAIEMEMKGMENDKGCARIVQACPMGYRWARTDGTDGVEADVKLEDGWDRG